MSTDKNTIKNWFKTGLKPTQSQFWTTWDSFWHKDEKLPISSIDNLGGMLDGKAEANHTHTNYATNDATSLTAENVTEWQDKLGVADLKFDDKAITITQDYADFGLVVGDSINAFNNAIYSEVAKKLDAPTENATNSYVLMADGSTVAKSDFGKVDKVMGVASDANKNVDFSGVAMNWTNPSQRFSGLINKSSDATYNILPVFDSNGNMGKASNLYNVFKNGLQGLTQSQALEIGQLLNGGQGSSGAISVNLISPPIIQNRFDSVEYVLLRGANLLLNSTDMSISICDVNKNVIQQIPNNQIINNSSTTLIFYYNFHQFAEGTYILKITSGVKVYYTTFYIKIVDEIENINLDSIMWDNVHSEGIVLNANDVYAGRNFILNTPAFSENNNLNDYSFKSSELFSVGENFYIEMELSISQGGGGSYGPHDARIGVGYSDIANSLVPIPSVYLSVRKGSDSGQINYGIQSNYYVGAGTPITISFVIIKTGNLFRIIQGANQASLTLSNNSGYSLYFQTAKRNASNVYSLQVIRAFKFI